MASKDQDCNQSIPLFNLGFCRKSKTFNSSYSLVTSKVAIIFEANIFTYVAFFNHEKKKTQSPTIHMVVLKTADSCYSCDCRSSTDVLLNVNSHILTLI